MERPEVTQQRTVGVPVTNEWKPEQPTTNAPRSVSEPSGMWIDAKLYPQLAKMEDAQSSSQVIGEFLEWLGEHGMFVGKHIVPEGWTTEVFTPISEGTESLLARYFDIDLKAVERERRAVLAGVNPSDDFAQVKAQIMSMSESNLRQCAIAQAIQLGFHEKYGNAMSNANAAFVAEQKTAAGVEGLKR